MVRIGKNGVRKNTDFKKKSCSHPVIQPGYNPADIFSSSHTLGPFYVYTKDSVNWIKTMFIQVDNSRASLRL